MPALGPEPVNIMDTSLDEDFTQKREEMQRVAKDCMVVIDNLPKAGPEKYARLTGVVTPLFERSAEVRRDEDGRSRVTIVQGDDGSSLGFAFVEYTTPEEAQKALSQLHNYQLDKAHRFWACTAGDLQKLQEMSNEFVPPAAVPIAKDRPDFKSWLLDERGRDQFLIRHEDEMSIYWHDHIIKPQLVSLQDLFVKCKLG